MGGTNPGKRASSNRAGGKKKGKDVISKEGGTKKF